MSEAKVRGKVVTAALDSVKPNDWNPNIVPEHKMRALERAMREEGWLASQALLIWKTDKEGNKKNVIIDGEHRWLAARAVGIVSGPMVFLDGLSEAEAKALTVKVDNIRGQFDNDALSALLREIQGTSDDLTLEFGFDTIELDALLNDVVRETPEQNGQAERGGGDPDAKATRAPGAPVELTEAQVAADIGTKKLRLVVVCEDRVYAQRVAELLSANSIAFEERFE